jgi:hypothetical protein
VAVVLIRGQITHLAYGQIRVLFESDFRNVRAALRAKAEGLLAVGTGLGDAPGFAVHFTSIPPQVATFFERLLAVHAS